MESKSHEKEVRTLLEPIDDAPKAEARTRTLLEPVSGRDDDGASVRPVRHSGSGRIRRGFFLAGAGLAALLLLAHTALELGQLLRASPLLGAGWSVVAILLVFAAGGALWRFWRVLGRLRGRDELQQRAQFLLRHHGVSEGVGFCTRLATLSGDLERESFRQWRDSLSVTHNDREVLALYGQMVLAEADTRALERVVTHAGDVTVMVALSRFPLLDMLFVLWRQLRLVEDVARSYGVDAGYWGRIRLLRVILRNMALAGGAEIAAEIGTQVMGAGAMAKISTATAQGIGAGILTARLGLRAMTACRVIPWDENERPRLRQVSKGVLANVRRYLGAGSDDPDEEERAR